MATKNERSSNRINTINTMLAEKNERLSKLTPMSAAHKRCSDAIRGLEDLRVQIEASMQKRGERHAAYEAKVSERKPLRGERFEVETGDDLVGYGEGESAQAAE